MHNLIKLFEVKKMKTFRCRAIQRNLK